MNHTQTKNFLKTGRTESFFKKFKAEQLFMLPFLSTIYSVHVIWFYLSFAVRYAAWWIRPTMDHERLDLDFKDIAYKGYFHEFVLVLNATYWSVLPNGRNNSGILNYLNHHFSDWIYFTYYHLNHI